MFPCTTSFTVKFCRGTDALALVCCKQEHVITLTAVRVQAGGLDYRIRLYATNLRMKVSIKVPLPQYALIWKMEEYSWNCFTGQDFLKWATKCKVVPTLHGFASQLSY